LKEVNVAMIAGRFETINRISGGGMGDVWIAQDTRLGRKVALKLVQARLLDESPGSAAVLRDEAILAGKLLGHAGVVGVLDLLELSESFHMGPVIVMEYVEGCNLAQWISKTSHFKSEATRVAVDCYIGLRLVEAIQFAQRNGTIHRDIKPSNVMLSNRGQIKVTDFGLARVMDALTRTHTVKGNMSPLYAAPEQWLGGTVNKDVDYYQLGATLVHLIARRPLCPADDFLGILRWHENKQVDKSCVPIFPTELAELAKAIDDCLLGAAKGELWEISDKLAGLAFIGGSMECTVDRLSETEAVLLADLLDAHVDDSEVDGQPSRRITVRTPNLVELVEECLMAAMHGATNIEIVDRTIDADIDEPEV
jgi:serine/threonine protein kinase